MIPSVRTNSIGKNLSISLIIVISIVISITAVVFGYFTSVNDRHSLDMKADELIRNIVKSVEYPIWNYNNDELIKLSEIYFISEYVSELVITDARTRHNLVEYRKKSLKEDLIFREGTVSHNGREIANVHIGLTTLLNRTKLANVIYSYIATTIILVFILVMVTDYLLKIFLKNPFDNLIHAMEKMSMGQYNPSAVPVPQAREFEPITTRFTYMAEQIQERERSLSRTKDYISDIFDSIDSMIFGVDSSLEIIYWNRSAEGFRGFPAESAKGSHFFECFPIFSELSEKLEAAAATGATEKDYHIQSIIDGDPADFSISILPLSFEGERGAVVLVEDISEKMKLDEMIIQTEKMLSVGGLAAGMAHEINNPLAGILQNIQVIENRLFKSDIPANLDAAGSLGLTMELLGQYLEMRKVPDLFRSVRNAGRRATKIVDNMLSFSRKSGSGFIENDIVRIFEDTVELASNDYDLKKKYDFRNIRIIREFDDNLPCVPCDATRIQLVILNILKNGAYAMCSGDCGAASDEPHFRVRIRVADSENGKANGIKGSNLHGDLELQIEDNGPGMDEKTRKRVFEPFFRTKAVGVGTGLGLSVSYFIITENHGGSMSVVSSPGKGSTFSIRLPLNRKSS